MTTPPRPWGSPSPPCGSGPPAAVQFCSRQNCGAYVALRACAQWPVDGLVTVAPPVNLYDFNVLETPRCPWLLIQGEEDEVVPAADVTAWVEGLDPGPQFVRLPGVGHFFHQRLHDLRTALALALGPVRPPRS